MSTIELCQGGTAMRFFFDTDDGERRIEDGSGIDLPDESEAIEQAVSLLRDLSHVPLATGPAREFSVRVRGADGRDLYAATLRLALQSLG